MRVRGTIAGVALLMILFAGMMSSCKRRGSDQDPVIGVSESDPEMLTAIAKARETLPQFWQVMEHPQRGESDFCLKVKITDQHGAEHFWVRDIERKDAKIFGIINSDPDTVKNVKLGDRITIPEADISDWLYMRGGKMVGNYTIRALFKEMSSAEVQSYKKMLADP